MKNIIQEPTVVVGDRGEVRTNHPAFAQIGASRCNGHAVLYGSDFHHQATIRIRIGGSELIRDLYRDRYHGKKQYIEVELSEAQWATFVSSMNIGDGVPCTLRYLQQESVPNLPEPVDRSKQFAGEVDKKCGDCLSQLQELYNKLDTVGLSKKKADELKVPVSRAIMELKSNLPFIAESFGEHIEDTLEKAKQEIHGYTMGLIAKTGIDTLGGTGITVSDKSVTE